MSEVLPPPPVPRKRRLGCLGWGALIVFLLVVGFFILVAIGMHNVGWMQAVSSDELEFQFVPSGPDWITDAANTGTAISDFETKLQNNRAATLTFTANQINNTLGGIFESGHVGLRPIFNFTGNEGEVTLSAATDGISNGSVKGRYLNLDMTFGPKIDSVSKKIQIIPHSMIFTVPTDGKDSQNGAALTKKPLDPSDVPTLSP